MVVVDSMGAAVCREWEQWSGCCSRHVEVAVSVAVIVVVTPWWWLSAWVLLHVQWEGWSGHHSGHVEVVVGIGGVGRTKVVVAASAGGI